MNLILIYGPPAVGKLTVAKKLVQLTGYKLFHNHLTIDLVNSIFEYGTKDFMSLCDRFRIEILEAAAKADINGIVFTFCFAATPEDQVFIEKCQKTLEKYGGSIKLVRLFTSNEELEKRVVADDRIQFKKINSASELKSVLAQYSFFENIPSAETLQIDNTDISPEEVAHQILRYYILKFTSDELL